MSAVTLPGDLFAAYMAGISASRKMHFIAESKKSDSVVLRKMCLTFARHELHEELYYLRRARGKS